MHVQKRQVDCKWRRKNLSSEVSTERRGKCLKSLFMCQDKNENEPQDESFRSFWIIPVTNKPGCVLDCIKRLVRLSHFISRTNQSFSFCLCFGIWTGYNNWFCHLQSTCHFWTLQNSWQLKAYLGSSVGFNDSQVRGNNNCAAFCVKWSHR